MNAVRKTIITSLIICFIAALLCFHSVIWRFVVIQKCVMQNNGNLTQFIQTHNSEIHSITDYLAQHPHLSFRSLGNQIFVRGKDAQGLQSISLELDDLPPETQQSLQAVMLESESPIWIESIKMAPDDEVAFEPHLECDPVLVYIFARTGETKEKGPGLFELYQESVHWVHNCYVSYGIMKRG